MEATTSEQSSWHVTSAFLTRGGLGQPAADGSWDHLPILQYLQAQLPRRLWWLKLTALADLEDWEELEKFSKSKKSPIGYLVRHGPSLCPTFRQGSPGERTRPRDRQADGPFMHLFSCPM